MQGCMHDGQRGKGKDEAPHNSSATAFALLLAQVSRPSCALSCRHATPVQVKAVCLITHRMILFHPQGFAPESVTLEQAAALLLFPRNLGPHPTDGRPVTVNKGRFGPYASHGALAAPLPAGLQPEALTLDHALQVSGSHESSMST